MGSSSHLIIAGYPTFSYKNHYHDQIVSQIFQPSDFISEKRKCITRNTLIWGDAYENDKDAFTFKGFRQTVGICKRRLEIFGMNLKAVKNDFRIAKQIAAEHYYYNNEYDFPISKVSFDAYFKELKSIITNKSIDFSGDRDTLRSSLITDELYISGQSYTAALYSILSCVSENEIVEYDLSDVIKGGWVKANTVDNIIFEKIIILTEGKTDTLFLSKSLQLLYPYLFPYYHFMDFEGYKVEGSASALVKTLKAFAASNVKHPIIAVFDNDTAGIAEMNHLPKVLPKNIKAMKLPNIQIAKKYPTIGPGGIKNMNVNGLACGIELYLGEDVLSGNGSPSKIRWSNFNENLKQYQGALENKIEIQKTFLEKIKLGERWNMPEMEELLDQIFKAFQL